MSKGKHTSLFFIIGLLISSIPPAICVLLYFPLWQMRGSGAVLSGFSVLLIIICAIPIFNALKRILRSPSAPVVWLIIFIIFSLVSKIADEMTVISFVGFISNLLGSVFFGISKRGEMEQAKHEEKRL